MGRSFDSRMGRPPAREHVQGLKAARPTNCNAGTAEVRSTPHRRRKVPPIGRLKTAHLRQRRPPSVPVWAGADSSKQSTSPPPTMMGESGHPVLSGCELKSIFVRTSSKDDVTTMERRMRDRLGASQCEQHRSHPTKVSRSISLTRTTGKDGIRTTKSCLY